MKKIMIIAVSATLFLFSCNKEDVVTNEFNNNNQVISISSSKDKDMEYRGPKKKCGGTGVDCIESKEVIIKGFMPTFLTALDVQAYFTTGAGSIILPSLSQSIQNKLISGYYSMQINYSDSQCENYVFTYGNDVFALQFNVQ